MLNLTWHTTHTRSITLTAVQRSAQDYNDIKATINKLLRVSHRGLRISEARVKAHPEKRRRHAGRRGLRTPAAGWRAAVGRVYLWSGGRSVGRGSESAPVWTWQPFSGTQSRAAQEPRPRRARTHCTHKPAQRAHLQQADAIASTALHVTEMSGKQWLLILLIFNCIYACQ